MTFRENWLFACAASGLHGSATGEHRAVSSFIRGAARGARAFWPREHGAYGQLLAPLLSAFAFAGPTPAALACAALALALFLAHEAARPELRRVRQQLEALASDLEPHMMKEEQLLFPCITALSAGQPPAAPFGRIEQPLRVMQLEHDQVGALLRELDELTFGYCPPRRGVRASPSSTRAWRICRPICMSTSTSRTTCCFQRRSR